MGLKLESTREHIELPKLSDVREDYIEGKLFKVGDEVVLKESGDIGNILVCGTNHLVVEFGAWKKRVWLDQVELAEKHDDDPCWDSHKQVGTKKKNGKTVPNCVPKEDFKLKSFKDIVDEGLWDNIHKKRKSGKKMNKKGHPDAPTDAELKAAQGKKK